MQLIALALAASLTLATQAVASEAGEQPIRIVAAENFYGDVAQQIGGGQVSVTSILQSPGQDPHLFEATPSAARALADAGITIANGADYDPWMDTMLAASHATGRNSVVVADLVGRKAGDNPHIWYDPNTMLALAARLADILAQRDSSHAEAFRQHLDAFQASLAPITVRIAGLRARLAGTPVTATEPVFGDMFDALGMTVRNAAFQRAVMNDTEPSAEDVRAFETDLREHRVKLLVFNSQASDAVADRLRAIAVAAGVSVVGATETEPPGMRYQAWMNSALDAVDAALPGP